MPYPNDDFKMASDAGFDGIAFDLSHFCISDKAKSISVPGKKERVLSACAKVACSFEGDEDALKEHFSAYKNAAAKYSLKIVQVNAVYPYQIPDGDDKDKAIFTVLRNCINICEWLGSAFLIIRPFKEESMDNREWQMSRHDLLALASIAKERDVILCIENQCKYHNGRYLRGFCTEPYKAAEYIDGLNSEFGEERFGICLNTGVCGLVGQGLRETVLKLGKRIRTVRIEDNDGIHDQSSMPFTCSRNGTRSNTDWQGFICAMRETGFQGPLSFDAAGSIHCFPSNMRFSVLRLVFETGRFMAEQIEIEKTLKECGQIVLFGAGNMFENYMVCFGEKYPPAFIVDNNSKNWGTVKQGVPIKSPDAIRELDGSYGVFICNQFYYGIERQLEDMGVKNIYRFHDEYISLQQKTEAK